MSSQRHKMEREISVGHALPDVVEETPAVAPVAVKRKVKAPAPVAPAPVEPTEEPSA
jgi:hypothetical protein